MIHLHIYAAGQLGIHYTARRQISDSVRMCLVLRCDQELLIYKHLLLKYDQYTDDIKCYSISEHIKK